MILSKAFIVKSHKNEGRPVKFPIFSVNFMARLLVIFFLWCGFFPVVSHAQKSLPEKAVYDLSSWDVSKHPIKLLDMPWEFYPYSLLSPDEFKHNHHGADDLVKPSSWSEIKIKGKAFPSKAYATYRITFVNLPKVNLSLDAYSVQTSCRIFINERLVAEVGKPGVNKETTVPSNRDVQVALPFGIDTAQIVLQIANFHHRKGGFVHPFELGTTEAVNTQRLMFYSLDFIESSALAIIGLFLFAMYIFRRKDLSILYFALFCITLAFRPVISVNYLLATIFPDMSWHLLLKIEYLSVLFPCLFMLLFIKKLFPNQLPGWFVFIWKWILIIKIAVVLCFTPDIFSWIVLPLLFVISTGVIMFIIAIMRAMYAKVEGANYAGVGILILLLSLLLKVTSYSGIIPPVHVLITTMDIAFIFAMSLILGSRFSFQFTKVEVLQQETEAQHKEILDSIRYAKRIQQAIMTSEKYIVRNLNRLKKN